LIYPCLRQAGLVRPGYLYRDERPTKHEKSIAYQGQLIILTLRPY
jgi:hypothetical protein